MIELLLVGATLILAVMAILSRRLLTAALWLAGVSALLAVLFYRLGAPGVAVIELSVGAGLVTVLFVFAISVAGDELLTGQPRVPRALAAGFVILTILLLGVLALPAGPEPAALLERPLPEVMWQERGLDVLVQVALIFAGVMGLLGLLAEAKAPLAQPAAAEVAARREREMLELQQKTV